MKGISRYYTDHENWLDRDEKESWIILGFKSGRLKNGSVINRKIGVSFWIYYKASRFPEVKH